MFFAIQSGGFGPIFPPSNAGILCSSDRYMGIKNGEGEITDELQVSGQYMGCAFAAKRSGSDLLINCHAHA